MRIIAKATVMERVVIREICLVLQHVYPARDVQKGANTPRDSR